MLTLCNFQRLPVTVVSTDVLQKAMHFFLKLLIENPQKFITVKYLVSR